MLYQSGYLTIKDYDERCFENDLATIRSKDDVLTALIHLGCLTYDAETKQCLIPNMEVEALLNRTSRRTLAGLKGGGEAARIVSVLYRWNIGLE